MRKRKHRFTDYDYEEVFKDPLELASEKTIERLLQLGKMKSVYATKTIRAGSQFEVEIYPEFTKQQCREYGIRKRSYQAQKNLNDKNSRKRLERLINANFKDGDLWITLTYDSDHLPGSMEEALKNMKNYIRRINYRRKKAGLPPAKYIYITEWNEKKKIRCHHHMIMDGAMSMDDVEKLWKCGKRNNVRRVAADDAGLSGLAQYLAKDPAGSKRWCSSLNLEKPKESKSYHAFRGCHVRKMVNDREEVRRMTEKRYPKMRMLSCQVRYNEINGRYYIHVRMTERTGRRRQ